MCWLLGDNPHILIVLGLYSCNHWFASAFPLLTTHTSRDTLPFGSFWNGKLKCLPFKNEMAESVLEGCFHLHRQAEKHQWANLLLSNSSGHRISGCITLIFVWPYIFRDKQSIYRLKTVGWDGPKISQSLVQRFCKKLSAHQRKSKEYKWIYLH